MKLCLSALFIYIDEWMEHK